MFISVKFGFPYSAAIKQQYLEMAMEEERTNIYGVTTELIAVYPQLLNLLTDEGKPKSLLFTVNGQIGNSGTAISDGDVVQFLYPYTGG